MSLVLPPFSKAWKFNNVCLIWTADRLPLVQTVRLCSLSSSGICCPANIAIVRPATVYGVATLSKSSRYLSSGGILRPQFPDDLDSKSSAPQQKDARAQIELAKSALHLFFPNFRNALILQIWKSAWSVTDGMKSSTAHLTRRFRSPSGPNQAMRYSSIFSMESGEADEPISRLGQV